jgi:alpha-ketoglutarate-dependent taurine dioxygenase
MSLSTVESSDLELSSLTGTTLLRVISPPRESSVAPVTAWMSAGVEQALATQGAVLFRGFPVGGASDFQRFIQQLTPSLLDYDFGSTPRSRLHDRIYTSTEYPAHQSIPLHNEQSYTTEWPLKLWFHCERPAEQGGSTPLADSGEVLRLIPARIRERFVAKRVMYLRNYGTGLDVPWQQVFGTGDRAAVERYCRNGGIACEWNAEGELRTRQVCQAVAAHPRTGELVWFNQAHLFHISSLPPAARQALTAAFADDELPRHALYGDGSPIEESVLDEIRSVYRRLTVEFSWQRGDVLLVDNMKVAHGRTPYQGARKVLVAMAEPHRASAC